jgi:phosphoglucosamine mutase
MQAKLQKNNKTKAVKMKEVKLRVGTDVNDYNVKMSRTEQFLDHGHKVRFQLRFRNRENAHRELGLDVMAKVVEDMKTMGQVDQAAKLAGNTVVGTIMTNFGFTKFCDEQDIKFIATKVGDRFVLEEMNLCGYSLGGEQSGHIIFRDYATTGDGQLTAVQLLSIMVKEKKSLSELASVMTKAPQTMINLKISANGKRLFYTDATIKQAIDEAAAELGNTGRIVVRPSGTEPLIRVMAEGENEKLIETVANRVADVINERLGNK